MNREILQDYFNNPYDDKLNNTLYVKLWCKRRIQEFVDRHMDDNNYKFFGEFFKLDYCPITNFYKDDWHINDNFVYETIEKHLRKKAEMSNRNVRIFAKFIRMNYFINYVKANSKTIANIYELFDDIYDLSLVSTLQNSSKRIFKGN